MCYVRVFQGRVRKGGRGFIFSSVRAEWGISANQIWGKVGRRRRVMESKCLGLEYCFQRGKVLVGSSFDFVFFQVVVLTILFLVGRVLLIILSFLVWFWCRGSWWEGFFFYDLDLFRVLVLVFLVDCFVGLVRQIVIRSGFRRVSQWVVRFFYFCFGFVVSLLCLVCL